MILFKHVFGWAFILSVLFLVDANNSTDTDPTKKEDTDAEDSVPPPSGVTEAPPETLTDEQVKKLDEDKKNGTSFNGTYFDDISCRGLHPLFQSPGKTKECCQSAGIQCTFILTKKILGRHYKGDFRCHTRDKAQSDSVKDCCKKGGKFRALPTIPSAMQKNRHDC